MNLTELLVKSLAGLFLPLFCIVDLERSNGLMPAAGDAKQTAYHARCRACSVDHWGQFVLAQRVYGAAREPHN